MKLIFRNIKHDTQAYSSSSMKQQGLNNFEVINYKHSNSYQACFFLQNKQHCLPNNPTIKLGHALPYDFNLTLLTGRKLQGMNLMKRKHLLTNNADSINIITPPTFEKVLTTYVPTPTPPTDNLLNPQTWFFNLATRELCNTTSRIKLTVIESLLVKALTLSNARICSKQEIILGIGKDPQTYSGLEMSLSRLQNKFRSVFNERLFRSVRNRGYCLVQDVKISHQQD